MKDLPVIITNNPPNAEELKRQNAVVARSLWEAAEIVVHTQLLGWIMKRHSWGDAVKEVYYDLLMQSRGIDPVFGEDKPPLQSSISEQLRFDF